MPILRDNCSKSAPILVFLLYCLQQVSLVFDFCTREGLLKIILSPFVSRRCFNVGFVINFLRYRNKHRFIVQKSACITWNSLLCIILLNYVLFVDNCICFPPPTAPMRASYNEGVGRCGYFSTSAYNLQNNIKISDCKLELRCWRKEMASETVEDMEVAITNQERNVSPLQLISQRNVYVGDVCKTT